MNKFATLLLLVILSISAFPARAEDGQLTLTIKRNFGYAGGREIQGLFTLTATGPQDLKEVSFYLDGSLLGTVSQAPFQLRFSTDSYSTGAHTLHAEGVTASGGVLVSNQILPEFVTGDEVLTKVGKIIIPLLLLVFGAMLIPYLPVLFGRKTVTALEPGAARKYGVLGGAICPKCSRPFALHVYAMNFVTHKLDRCPYCGRWSLVQRVDPAMLRIAEIAEAATTNPGSTIEPQDEADRLARQVEQSRYLDL